MSQTSTRPGARRVLAAIATVAAAALVLSGCSASSSSESSKEIDPNAIIQAGISYSLSGSFDPMVASGAVTLAANWHVFEGLVDLDPVTHDPYPALAAEMPKKIDDTTYELKLRDGAKFSDGTPVTTEDVVFSYDRVMNPDSKSLFAPFVSFIDQVVPVDEQTVQIKTKYPFSLIEKRLGVVKIVPEAVVSADADAFGKAPIGSGPYALDSAVPNDSLVFSRNDNYNGTRPALAAGMKWNLLSDAAARETALTSGTIQAMEDAPYIDTDYLASTPGISVDQVQSFGQLFMMFNTQSAPFDDVRVRQAFFYALNMDKIIKSGLLGNAEAATSFLPQSNPGYNEASTVYTYQPEKAKELLAEAGVSNLSINLLTTDTGWVKDVAPLIKESLDAAGIKTTLDIGQSGAQYKKVDAGDFQVMVAPGDPSVFGNDPDILMRWWYGDNVWPKSRYRWSGTPEFAELTGLLDTAQQADGEEQQKVWNETFDFLSENVPLYPLFHRKVQTAWNSETLVGFKPLSTTGLSFLDVGVAKTVESTPTAK